MNDLAAPFAPDWVSPPGDTLLDIIEERDWTQAELAQRLGYTTKHVNQLIKGKVPLTEDAAIRLERVVGSTVGFWLAREAKYRERCARLEAAEKFTGWIDWLDQLPIKELMHAGAIEKRRVDAKSKPGLVESCLRFFGVASPEEWQSHYGQMQAAFRRSREEQSDVGAISAWLRMGEQEAEKQDGPKYDRARFEAALTEIRALTNLDPEEFQPHLHTLFRQAGVAFVLVPGIPKAHVSGVARWLNPHRPLIQLSLYGKTNDKFWFTLFHEAAHVLLHAKEKKSVYLDDPTKAGADSVEEREANDWAGNFLIPDRFVPQLIGLRTKAAVCDFAGKIGIHPGIVVGRLQHDGLIDPSWMNDLRVSFRFIAAE
ncbi:MAG: ImmA/IrrE family metallo-endopeptidase [Sulfuricella sp.]|jgi:HTH-type transcriptional regulator/antitoxin HigA